MNAKEELLNLLKEEKVTLKCGYVEEVYYRIPKQDRKKFLLPVGYKREQLNRFMKELNFDYDNGYGSEELGGTLWFTDGTWADRGEYDGSEWWEYHKLPEIPEELNQLQGSRNE